MIWRGEPFTALYHLSKP